MQMFRNFIFLSTIICTTYFLQTCSEEPTKPPPPPSIDTTSHNFVWRIDTIGTWQSYFAGVWGTDSNNVYAVGWIYLPDNDTVFNVMHWEGKNWNPIRKYFGDPHNIYGFDKNDFWMVGITMYGADVYPKITHWNGINWQEWEFPWLKNIYANGIWGSSSNNMFVVGNKGLILHYDGTQWTQLISPTNLNLLDIWSINNNWTPNSTIYAIGSSEDNSTGALLKYSINYWSLIFERKTNGSQLSGGISTIWGWSDNNYYSFGGYAQLYTGHDITWKEVKIPNSNTIISRIRGSAWNNVFATGSFGLIIHYNGSTWKRYDEFYKKPNGDELGGIWTNGSCVYIVGQSRDQRAIVYIGKR